MRRSFIVNILLLTAIITFTTVCKSTLDVVISKKVDISKKLKKIAVFPFDIKGVKWGDEFAECIGHQFFKSGKVEIVEREAIEKVFKEQKLSMSGILDPRKVIKLGKLFGADVIIIGKGNALRRDKEGNDVRDKNIVDTFSLKALSVETGSTLITVRKEPGVVWTTGAKVKVCASAGCIWDSNDILRENSKYDEIAKNIVHQILAAMQKIEASKNVK